LINSCQNAYLRKSGTNSPILAVQSARGKEDSREGLMINLYDKMKRKILSTTTSR